MKNSEQGSSHEIYYTQLQPAEPTDTCFLFIHGFASDATEWEHIYPVISQTHSCFALSLPGCYGSVYPEWFTPKPAELGSIVEDFVNEFPHKKKILCGYSMGARLALYTALHHSPEISGLILESGTPGIRNQEERNKRAADDSALADTISQLTGEEFEKLWKGREIFSSQSELPPRVAERLQQKRIRSNPALLAEYLRHFGTGVMPDMWNDLHRISVPVLLISGELDQKFSQIGEEMKNLIPNSEHKIVPGAGHNTHLEKPADFVNLLFNFSNNL